LPAATAAAGRCSGIACPLGAHYLPLPGDDAREVQDLLEELGLRRRVAGRWQYDERHLCHSPQERLYFNGEWQDGLLPLQGTGPGTLAQYRHFAQRVAGLQRTARFASRRFAPRSRPGMPRWTRMTFAAWLDAGRPGRPAPALVPGLLLPRRLWRRAATVSAWAGLHYFASRHGFPRRATPTPAATPC
jgi:hypothetical protein